MRGVAWMTGSLIHLTLVYSLAKLSVPVSKVMGRNDMARQSTWP